MLQVNKDKILEIPFVPSELHLHTSRSFKALFRYSRAVFVSEMQQRRGSDFKVGVILEDVIHFHPLGSHR